MKYCISLLLITLLFCGFNPIKVRYQKVEITTNSKNKIYIDGEIAYPEKGKYLIPRDQKPHLIEAKREGYKDAQVPAIPYKSNGYTYPEEYEIGMDMVKLPEKSADGKNIRVDEVTIDIKLEDNLIRRFSDYDTYLKKKDKIEAVEWEDEDEDIKIKNSIYSYTINEFLKENGFIDTSNRVFKNGYLNNLITSATISKYTYHRAPSHNLYDYGGMIYVDILVDWKLSDIYGEELFEFSTKATSSQFVYEKNDDIKETVVDAVTDALENGLLEFMSTSKVSSAVKDKSILETEDNFDLINIPKALAYANDLSGAIKSSVTVKVGDGHGSGFLISDEGHIVTNYHVIVNSNDEKKELNVIMNDKTEYKPEVLRVSKIHDLALLKIDLKEREEKIKPLSIDLKKDIEIAADIYAVGTPKAEDLSQTVSKGIISGVRKTDQDTKLIQIDASINNGNSGGAIVNSEAKVIGIVSSKLFGYGVEGVAFGIPAYQLYEKLKLN